MNNNNINNDWKVSTVEFDNGTYSSTHRLYNELTTDSYFAFYNETSLKIHELVERFSFKIYHIKTTPFTNLKIFLENGEIDIKNDQILQIKFLQSNDLFYLYMNLFFEVIYFIPHTDKNNNYSYSFIVLVEKNFNINWIKNHNFNLVKIKSCVEIQKNDINFDYIQNFFESRTLIDNWAHCMEEFKYNLNNLGINREKYELEHKKENGEVDWNYFSNLESIEFYKNFNQNLYCYSQFKLLCTHIIDFGRVFHIEKNDYGKTHRYEDFYYIHPLFFTNFYDLGNAKVLKLEGVENVSSVLENCHTSPLDNYHDQWISSTSASKEFVLNGFIDFTNKKVIKNFKKKAN